jgi:hypothetical protein
MSQVLIQQYLNQLQNLEMVEFDFVAKDQFGVRLKPRQPDAASVPCLA